MKILRYLTLGAIAGLGVMAGPTAVSARASTGFGAFRNLGGQGCVTESFGGAFNSCSTTQSYMIFDLPNDVGGNVTVSGWSDGSGSPFSCYSVALNPSNSSTFNQGAIVAYPSGNNKLSSTVNVPSAWAIRFQCENVPVGRGMGGFTW